MARKPTVKTLKRKLDKIFSEYIRLRDADENGYCRCCSCGVRKSWTEMHAGHWINRRHGATRYDEKNVHAQCPKCNVFEEGNASGYSRFMLSRYGTEIMDALDDIHYETHRFTVPELQESIEIYKKKLIELKGQKDD